MRSQSHILYVVYLFVATTIITFTSCSSDYRNVIPAGSTALMSFDLKQMMKNGTTASDKRTDVFKDIFNVSDITDCGINLEQKIYAFETTDGSLGMVASVSSSKDVEDWLKTISNEGNCSEITEKKGYKFVVFKECFIVGFSSSAILVMGPVIKSSQVRVQNQMIKYLGADDSDGIVGTPLYEKLSSQDGSVALVAQAQALPDKLVAPFTLGAPKDTSLKDILIVASMTLENECLCITGEVTSFKEDIDKALKSSASYKPFSDKYMDCISSKSLISTICGIDGESLVNLMRSNDMLRTLLIGLNTTIDIDNMLKSIDGDLLMSVQEMTGDRFDIQLIADTDNSDWLADVGYWKKTTPEGSRIANWKFPDSYSLTSSDMNLFFGLNDRGQLYLGTTEKLADMAGQPVSNSLPDNIKTAISRKRLGIIVNVDELAEQKKEIKTMFSLITPVFGDIKMIVFSIK